MNTTSTNRLIDDQLTYKTYKIITTPGIHSELIINILLSILSMLPNLFITSLIISVTLLIRMVVNESEVIQIRKGKVSFGTLFIIS